MNQSKIAVRYAKALFLIAKDKNLLESVKADMYLISEVLKSNEPFRDFLYSPVTKPSERRRILDVAFGEGKVQLITFQFLGVLVENNRIQFLKAITVVFFSIYRNYFGIKSVTIATAVEMEPLFQEKFMAVLTNIYKATIDLTLVQKPELIGGFVLTVEDQQYDASISQQLKNIRASLLSENLK